LALPLRLTIQRENYTCYEKYMRKIKVVSRKYNGTLRDEYEAFLYAQDETSLTVYTPPGTLDFDYRKGIASPAPDGLLELYFTTKWYTVWHICEQNSNFNTYVHIAMPFTLNGDTLAWVDLDLDYRVHMDGSLERLDEDEFADNSQTMHYPAHIIAQARAACAEIEQLYPLRAFPLNHQEQVAIYQTIRHNG
jgi:protein associated with RNAse G/E